MTIRRPLVVLLSCAVLLAACTSNPSLPNSSSQNALHFVNGSHYTYFNSGYGTVVIPKQTPAPIPTATWGDSITLNDPASFGGSKSLIDVTYRETYKTKQGTVTLSTHNFFRESSANGTTFIEHGGDAGKRFAQTYTSPAIVVELPFRAGNHWDPSASYVLQAPDRQERWNRDGSYVSRYQVALQIGSSTPMISHVYEDVRSDGSATMTQRVAGCVPTTERIGVPVSDNGHYVIPVEIRGAARCHGTPQTVATSLPDWYPGGGLPPNPLLRMTETDEGMSAVPSACGVPQSVATTAEKIVRVRSYVNPFGTLEESTDTRYYAQPLGLVCNVTRGNTKMYGVLGRGIAGSVTSTNVRSMQTFSPGAGAALPGDLAGNYLFVGTIVGACSASQLIDRNRMVDGSSIPALCRR